MALKQTIDQLMDRKMDRAEFIKLVGIAIAGIIGLARLIQVVTKTPEAQSGYGAGPYGGPNDGRS